MSKYCEAIEHIKSFKNLKVFRKFGSQSESLTIDQYLKHIIKVEETVIKGLEKLVPTSPLKSSLAREKEISSLVESYTKGFVLSEIASGRVYTMDAIRGMTRRNYFCNWRSYIKMNVRQQSSANSLPDVAFAITNDNKEIIDIGYPPTTGSVHTYICDQYRQTAEDALLLKEKHQHFDSGWAELFNSNGKISERQCIVLANEMGKSHLINENDKASIQNLSRAQKNSAMFQAKKEITPIIRKSYFTPEENEQITEDIDILNDENVEQKPKPPKPTAAELEEAFAPRISLIRNDEKHGDILIYRYVHGKCFSTILVNYDQLEKCRANWNFVDGTRKVLQSLLPDRCSCGAYIRGSDGQWYPNREHPISGDAA